MAAAHSNRSPSPLSSRPGNPNSRNSENNSATRRSFTGNKPSVLTNPRRFDPFTPANSPSDFASRRSMGKEGTCTYPRGCEEKENDEKDHNLKASKLQSPAKGSKNFMAPTISAASKFTPSPRKKVLVERNDPVRTSISLSDGKAMFFSSMSSNASEDLESKSEMGFHPNQKAEETSLEPNVADSEKSTVVKEDQPVSKPPKTVTFSEVPSDSHPTTESQSESVITDSDSLKLETSSKNNFSCSSVSPSIAPLDADPSFPPYDPKTNYLSPRPQFLHYKPNPRIEILLNKEKGVDPDEFNSLMAEIMSENFSDSEATEESQSEDSQREEMEVNDSADTVIGLEETEDDHHHVSDNPESLPVITTVTTAFSEENFVQKTEKKPWSLSRLMCFSMVLMVLVACVSMSVNRSPSLDEFTLNDLSLSDLSSLYHQSRIATSAKVNFDRLARNVNQLSVNSISFISKVADQLGKGEKLGPLQFMNLSDLQRDIRNEEHFLNKEVGEGPVENLEEDELEEEQETDMDTFEEKEAYGEDAYDDNFEKEFDAQDGIFEADETLPDSVKLAELESEYSENIQGQNEVFSNEKKSANQLATIPQNQEIELEVVVEVASDIMETVKNSEDQLAAIPKDQESELEAAVEVASDIADNINIGTSSPFADFTLVDHEIPSDVNPLSEGAQSSPMLESPQAENKFLSHYAMGFSSVFTALLAVVAFIYKYKRNPSLVNVVHADQFLSKHTGNGLGGIKHDYYQEKAFSQNWQTEVDDSTCPSEMSSFQKSASYSKKELRGGGASEAQSMERKIGKYSKRESLASSASEFSTGSPSYGSFTTFERIPIKHANGEEEIVTPVRRSSRIRNHH